jgi:hypothetical protein
MSVEAAPGPKTFDQLPGPVVAAGRTPQDLVTVQPYLSAPPEGHRYIMDTFFHPHLGIVYVICLVPTLQ